MTKQEYIKYWIEQSNDDWDAVEILLNGKKYLQALFFAHLTVEKLVKSLWIKYNNENVPPRSHNLNYLISFTPIELSVEISEFLLELNRFQLEGRYPEYMTKMYNLCNEKFTYTIIEKTSKVRLWLIENLQ